MTKAESLRDGVPIPDDEMQLRELAGAARLLTYGTRGAHRRRIRRLERQLWLLVEVMAARDSLRGLPVDLGGPT